MMKLGKDEVKLVGEWVKLGEKVVADATCERIHWLVASYLREVAISKEFGGWEILYQDPEDGRYWERTYPHGDWHGGEPPQLTVLNAKVARQKYERDIQIA